MHGQEFNTDGTLKPEARLQMLSEGMSNEAIDDYARRLKIKYDNWNHLDETDPEPWPVFTAYDFFTDEEKRQFNPDGSLRRDYIESARRSGTSESWLKEKERRKKLEVNSYNVLSAEYAEQGINFGKKQMEEKVASRLNYAQRSQQMEQDLANFEEQSSLPFDPNTRWR